MDAVLAVAGVMLVVAASLTVIRIVRGPGPADRVVATDVLITTVAGAVAVEAAINRHSHTLALILVLSLLAFAGTVSMARFVAGRRDVVGPDPGRGRAEVDPSEGDAPSPSPARDGRAATPPAHPAAPPVHPGAADDEEAP